MIISHAAYIYMMHEIPVFHKTVVILSGDLTFINILAGWLNR